LTTGIHPWHRAVLGQARRSPSRGLR
jgi:hypothetical protein